MIAERGDIARDRLEAALRRFRELRLGWTRNKTDETPEADETFPRLRGQRIAAPDTRENGVVILSRPPFMIEDFPRQGFDIALNTLENVCDPVDDRIEQSRQYVLARRTGHDMALRLSGVEPERQRLRITKRDEPVPGKHECHRHAERVWRVGLGDHRGGHIGRIVLMIEAARHLDLQHVLFRRHIETERLVEKGEIVVGRRKHIDPDRPFRDRGTRCNLGGFQHPVGGNIGGYHRICRFSCRDREDDARPRRPGQSVPARSGDIVFR